MPARFILSLDCEGKWGVADGLTPRHREALTDGRLAEAYGSILGLLDQYEISATFAFAGLFSQSAEQFGELLPDVDALALQAPAYLEPALLDMRASGGSGWHGALLVDAVVAARMAHEIALHGVSHIPWTMMDADMVEAEMRLFDRLAGAVRESRTFVYPRNLVAHPDALTERGFAGYRAAPPPRSRAGSLASEFNILERPQSAQASNGLITIPSGFFLNWRSGLRRVVPPAVTMRRARNLLDRADLSQGIVHYWLHPENIATAPATLDLLRGLIEEVARRRDAGRCEIMTQLGYCHWVRSLA